MKKKMLLFGLDGATFRVLEPLAQRGVMPFFNKLMKEGTLANLHSTIPFISPTAWSSFITGKNPGKHGVFDFRSKVAGSYDFEKNVPKIPKRGTIWKYLSEKNINNLIFNIPMTYPPQPIKGAMVSGFGSPGLDSNITFPKELKSEILERFNYVIDVYWAKKEAEKEIEILDEIDKMTETKFEVIDYLMGKNKSEFVAFALISPDRIQHRFFSNIKKYIENENYQDPVIKKFIEHMAMIDSRLKKFFMEWEFTDLIVMSDHGFGLCDKVVNLNTILQDKGWLVFQKQNGVKKSGIGKKLLRKYGITGHNLRKLVRNLGIKNASVIDKALYSRELIKWNQTKVFSVTFAGIYINLKNREPNGIVNEEDYEPLREEVIEELLKIKHNGNQIFRKIYKREEIYSGEHLEIAPDLVFGEFDGTYAINSALETKSKQIERLNTVRTGEHRLNGVFIAYGKNFKKISLPDEPEIIDLMPTILSYYNIPVPSDVDGRVLEEIFKEKPFMESTDKIDNEGTEDEDYTEEEQDKIIDNLKGLGYL